MPSALSAKLDTVSYCMRRLRPQLRGRTFLRYEIKHVQFRSATSDGVAKNISAWPSRALSPSGSTPSTSRARRCVRAASAPRAAPRATACGNCADGRCRRRRARRIPAPPRACNRGSGSGPPARRCPRTPHSHPPRRRQAANCAARACRSRRRRPCTGAGNATSSCGGRGRRPCLRRRWPGARPPAYW